MKLLVYCSVIEFQSVCVQDFRLIWSILTWMLDHHSFWSNFGLLTNKPLRIINVVQLYFQPLHVASFIVQTDFKIAYLCVCYRARMVYISVSVVWELGSLRCPFLKSCNKFFIL